MLQAESGCFYTARKERRPESLTMGELSSGLGFSSASVPVGYCPGVGDNLHSRCADGSLCRRLIFFHLDFDLLRTVLPDIQKQSSGELFEERI